MTSQSQYAVYDTSYTNRIPYITSAEYQSAPTAMDTNNLVSGGAQANAVALQETIARASSWVDQYCMGAWGTLCATVQTENGRIWGNSQGLVVHPKYWPILEVQSFSYAIQNGFAASVTPAGNCWIEPEQFIIQPGGTFNFGLGSPSGVTTGVQYQCVFQYVSGWPTSTLSASVSAGAASISPVAITGIYPGTTLTLYDLPYDEQVQVASTYVPGSSVVPLTAPLLYSHLTGVMVTNLPPAVKQAAILATTAFIKQRGSGSLIVDDMAPITRQSSGFSQNSGSDWDQAKALLNPFKAIFVGY